MDPPHSSIFHLSLLFFSSSSSSQSFRASFSLSVSVRLSICVHVNLKYSYCSECLEHCVDEMKDKKVLNLSQFLKFSLAVGTHNGEVRLPLLPPIYFMWWLLSGALYQTKCPISVLSLSPLSLQLSVFLNRNLIPVSQGWRFDYYFTFWHATSHKSGGQDKRFKLFCHLDEVTTKYRCTFVSRAGIFLQFQIYRNTHNIAFPILIFLTELPSLLWEPQRLGMV